VLIVDDAQWADVPSLRFLAFLARRVEPLPLALVVGGRPAVEWAHRDLHDAVLGAAATRVVRLQPLSRPASATLLSAVLCHAAPSRSVNTAVDETFADAVHSATGGNPFYLRELARAVGERGLGPTADNAGEIAQLGPGAVRRSVAARLAALPPSASAFAAAAAMLGERAPRAVVADLAGLERSEAALTERRLREIGLLEERASSRLRFAHPILLAAVRELQPFDARTREHARAAALLRAHGAPVAEVAAQLLHAAPAGDQEAVAVLREAARDAISRGAPEIAAHHLRRALAEPPRPADRGGLTLELGLAEAQQRLPGARGTLLRAIELSEQPDERLRAALALWTSDSFDGRYAAGFHVLEQTLQRSAGATPELLKLVELEVTRALRSTRATAAEGRARIADLRARLDFERARTTVYDRLAFALVALDDFYTNVPADELAALAERCLPLRDQQLSHDESQLPHIPLYALIFAERHERAIAVLDETIDAAALSGSTIGVEIGLVWRSLAHLRVGALAAAEADARHVLDAVPESRWRFGEAAARVWLAEVALERGDVRGAAELHAPLLDAAEISGRAWMLEVRLTQARILMAQGDVRGAFDVLMAIGRSELEFATTRPSSLPWRSQAAIAAARLGEVAQARRLATEEVELARLFGAPRTIAVALRARGLVTAEPEGRAALEQAVALLADTPARLEHARALTDLGERLAADGEPDAAVVRLRDGLAGAAACGALALERRAQATLADLGR
jgi:hypothetical protein